MINILQKWSERYFGHEEAVLLVVIIVFWLTAILTIGDILAPVIASAILAYLMLGMTKHLTGFGLPEKPSIWATYIIFIGGFFATLFVVLPLVWKQSGNLLNELPGMVDRLIVMLNVLPERYPEIFTEDQIAQVTQMATAELTNVGQHIVSFSLASLSNLVTVLIYSVLVPILVFLFMKDSRQITSWMVNFLPKERPLLSQIGNEMNEQVANYARGKALEILIVGGISYAAFTIMGLNYAALLSLLIGLSVLVPYIGAAAVTVPVALVAYFQWGFTADFFYLLLVYLIIQILDGNVLVPLLFSEAVNLHPVAIILAVLFFGGIWGLWGVFFAIPLATLVKAILNAWPVSEV